MKITIVGGGSYCWTPILFRDIIFTPGLEGSEIVLEDINRKHLDDLHRCCKAILSQTGKAGQFKVSATMDEDEALRGAHYVILTITTGGYDAMANDLRIPCRYGIYQPVGDTVGPGGLLRALRNIPVVANLARRMERRCPNAWLINITNPMSVLTRCVWRETDIRCVGLCHELYGTLGRLQELLGASDWRADFDCVTVGVNHLPWITQLRLKGRDAFPLLRRALEKGQAARASAKRLGTAFDATLIGSNQVKFELFKVFGALPAAGDRHLVEFFPFFCTRQTRWGAAMGVKLTTIEDRRRLYTPAWKRRDYNYTTGKEKIEPKVSQEATSRVIAALAGLHDWKDVVNSPNRGQVSGIAQGAIVETMGYIMRDQVYGLPVGPVPPAIITQIQRLTTNQEMTVEAALTGDRGLALQVLLNDPLSGIIGDFRKMPVMLDEMLRANRRWLPQFFGK